MAVPSTIATDEDLFAGFTNYVSSDEIGMFEDGMPDANSTPAVTPFTPSSWPCLQTAIATVWTTWQTGC
jgi:hypothetical protein